ncbi:MAG TPA: co-chaperone GroES [Phycisphaerae bacterium]|nr:co-chaperone GroES [Phycisphaerae bacterium]
MAKAKKLKTTLEPLADRVIIRRQKPEEVTEGGIVLPDAAQEVKARGTIVSVGPGRRQEDGEVYAVPLKVGDDVLYSKYAGTSIEVDGDEGYIILSADDVLARIKEAKK